MNGFPSEHTSMSLHPPAMNTPDTLTMVAARKSIIAPAIPCVLMMMVVLAHFSRVLRSRPDAVSNTQGRYDMFQSWCVRAE